MPRIFYNGSIQKFSGRMGNLIFRQMPDGTTVVSMAPQKMTDKEKKKFRLKRSASQKEHESRFQKASRYAKQAAREQPLYAELAAVTPMKTAYNFALSDWFHPPVIHRIERREGHILVEASDNGGVTRVLITVLDDEGLVLEKGEAVKSTGDCWEFACQTEGK